MATDLKIVEEAQKPLAMHPKKFAMWLFIATVVMLFAALTSAYIVRQAEGNWMIFELPKLFYVNTAVIIVSSFTMHWAYWSAKKDLLEKTKIISISLATEAAPYQDRLSMSCPVSMGFILSEALFSY